MNTSKPFTQACLNAGLISCGQITMNGIPKLIALTDGKMTWNKIPTTEETTVEAKNLLRENERVAHLAQASNGDFLKLAEKLGKLKDFQRNTKRGEVKDNGIVAFRGFVPLSMLTKSLPMWKSGKRQNVSGRDRVFLHLGVKPDVESKRVPASLKYWLPRIKEDAMMLVVIWVNPDDDGWLRVNFVIEDFLTGEQYLLRKDELPTEMELAFEQHLNCRADLDDDESDSFNITSLPQDWLVAQYASAITALETALQAEVQSPDEQEKLDAITNEKFASRA